MKCKLTFEVNGEEISLDIDSSPDSPLVDQGTIDILNQNEDQKKALCELIHNKLYKSGTIAPITVKEVTSKKGLMGNCSLDFLRSEFPEISFPDGVDANILLINNLRVGNDTIYGRIINSQGKELFIVRGSREDDGDIKKLANFLKTREAIEEQVFNFDQSSPYYTQLQEILKLTPNVHTIQELLLDFMYKADSYRKLYYTDNGKQISVYNKLQEITNIINNYTNRVQYEDEFVNTINTHRGYFKDKKSFLSIDSLYNAVKQYHPKILEDLKITSKTAFHKYFSTPSSEISEQLSKVFGQVLEGEGYNTLISSLLQTEPDCTLVFNSSTSKGIYLKQEYHNIETKYNISYNTIQSFDIINEDYKGYKIYAFNEDGQTKYIPSKGFLTEKDNVKKFNSEQEVKDYINSTIQNQSIRKYSLIEFKYRGKAKIEGKTIYDTEIDSLIVYSKAGIPEGKIIESIDIPVDKNTRIFNGEDILFKNNSKYSSFKEIISKWSISDSTKNNIFNKINTPEKIALFIYKVNERLENNRDNDEEINNIVNEIDTADKRYYYIESKDWIEEKSIFKYKVIPTNPILIDNYKKSKRTPVVTLMSAIATTLKDKFNVEVNLNTSEQLKELFPDIDANTDKAFIRDGKIYVNTTIARSTDLLHEYTHLVLGVLKVNPDLRSNYEQLMYQVSQTSEGKEVIENISETYKNLSKMDIMEEAFAKLFSGYIMRTYNPNVNKIFEGQDSFFKQTTRILFNTKVNDIKSFYGKSIDTIFKRFNSDVAWLLEQKGLDFTSTGTGRRYSNWISEQIEQGNIIENCE